MNLPKYRPDIDGLRAIAVLSVFIGHLNSNWLSGGFIGVDVFFVISGFLITSIILAQGDDFKITEFYNRRIKRILPVFYFVGFTTIILGFFVFVPEIFNESFFFLKTATYFLQNLYYPLALDGYFATDAYTKPYLHTWSLAVEEQFYLIFPFLLICFKKLKLSQKVIISILIILASLSFALSYLSFIDYEIRQINYYSLFTSRGGELLIGCIGAFLYSNKNLSQTQPFILNLAFISLIASLFLIDETFFYPSLITLIPTLSTILVIYFANSNSLVTKLLSQPILVFFGKISYSLYLWHWSIIVLTKEYFGIHTFSIKQALVIFIVSVSLSIFSYFCIEQVFRHQAYSFRKSFIMLYLIPASIIVGMYYGNKNFAWLNFGSQYRSVEYQKITSFSDIQDNTCYIEKPCVFGDKTKPAKILLIGDSHAKQLTQFLNIAGQKYGFAFEIIASGYCSFTEQYQKQNLDEISIASCKRTMKEIQNSSRLKDFDYVFIAGYFNYYLNKNGDDYLKELPIFINWLQQQHKKVVIFADIPTKLDMYKIKKYRHEFIEFKPITRDNFISHEVLNSSIQANLKLQQLSQQQNILFVDVFTPIVGSTQKDIKWPFKGKYLLYKDENHLNIYAHELLKDEFLEQVEKSPLDKIFKAVAQSTEVEQEKSSVKQTK